ncbi:hypothetical protein BY458DRAFT_530433, partial [Sporodiniella umbellata]
MSFFKTKRSNKDRNTDTQKCSSSFRLSINEKSLKEKFTNEEVDRLFEEAATRLNLNIKDATVRGLPTDKKWFILCHEGALTTMGAALATPHSDLNSSNNELTPSYYIRSIAKRDAKWTIRCKLVSDLSVRLRTMPIRWAQEFLEENGIKTLCDELSAINSVYVRNKRQCQLEFEIIKCLRQLFSNYYGIQQVVSDDGCIIQLAQSLLSPSISVQRLVCDALTFMCYFDQPKGHSMVVKGIELIKSENKPFSSWLNTLYSVLDNGNAKHTLVASSEETAMDISLAEHALAGLLLINALLDPDTLKDINSRVTLRKQLYEGGMAQVLDKLKSFKNELITLKLDEFKEMEDCDTASSTIPENTTLLEKLQRLICGTKAENYFQKMLQNLLSIQCETEIRDKYYRLIERFISQVTLNDVDTRLDADCGFSVKDMIEKFVEDEELEIALQEADEAREMAFEALEREAKLKVQVDLKADGLVGQFRLKNEALSHSLKVANQTNSVLQQRLHDIDANHKKTLKLMDSQIQRLYETVNVLVQKNQITQESQNFDILKSRIGQSMESLQFKINTDPRSMLLPKDLDKPSVFNTQNPHEPAVSSLNHQTTKISELALGNTSSPTFTPFSSAHPVSQQPSPPLTPLSTIDTNTRKSLSPVISSPPPPTPLIPSCFPLIPSPPPPPPLLTSSFTAVDSTLSSQPPPPPPPPPPPLLTSPFAVVGSTLSTSPPPPPPPPPPPLTMSTAALSSATPPFSPPTVFESEDTAFLKSRDPANANSSINGPPPSPPPPPPPLGTLGSASPLSSSSSPVSQPSNTVYPYKHQCVNGPEKSSMQPQKKLKFVEWEKIHQRQLSTTVWEQLGKKDATVVSELSYADVFTQIERSFTQKRATEVRKRKTNVLELLDPKKAYNMSIFLTGLSKEFDMHRLQEYLKEASPMIHVEHVLENLAKFAPTSEEAKTLKNYVDSGQSVSLLSKPDQLALEMLSISQFKLRVNCLLYKILFQETIKKIEKNFEILLNASRDLLYSENFQQLLQMILILGNYMNANTSRGGAYGIKIASINKLIDTKSSTNSSNTLLHFLVEVVEKSFPAINGFLSELAKCETANKVNQIETMASFSKLKKDLGQFDKLSNDDSFTYQLKQFQKEAQKILEGIEELKT